LAEALRQIELKILQESKYVTAALGAIGVTVASAAGAKNPKYEWFDFVPANLAAMTKERTLKIDRQAALVFKELLKQGRVPRWVMEMIDVKEVMEVAGG
jgi:hypothetical protein